MKVGFTFAFHHSEDIRPLGNYVTKRGVESFYQHCNYDFETFVIDNQSNPVSSFSSIIDLNSNKYSNLNYTYIENQYEKGITGARDLGVRQAFDAGCDIVILSNDDVMYDNTINTLIEYISKDPLSANSIYGPLASGITNRCQLSSGPTNKITQVVGNIVNQHLGGHVYVFTKEFYHNYKQPNGEMFIVDQHHNGGDGKWGGNEGNIMCWAEKGARCIVAGICHVHQQIETKQSWKKSRDLDRKMPHLRWGLK